MGKIITYFGLVCLSLNLVWAGTSIMDGKEQVLFHFDNEEIWKQWGVINDSVMGGRSRSQIKASENGHFVFQGHVSLENNGGFASVRSGSVDFDLRDYSGILVRLKGDGKKYRLSLKTDRFEGGIYYYCDIEAPNNEWKVVYAPFDDFTPKYRGQTMPDAPKLDRGKIRSVGFLIANKQEGDFLLSVDWIKAAARDN
jgi:hypothetical protein